MKKSQAVLEFLTTYGWAILVILITLGTLYYFGAFEFYKFLPQKCQFPSQFECLDFSFLKDETISEIRLKLLNNIGEEINILSYSITNDASQPLICDTPSTITGWKAGEGKNFVFSDCINGQFLVGERTDAFITMTYCAPSTPNCPAHTLKGKINAVVISP